MGQFAGRIGREEPSKRQMLYELFFEKLYKVYQKAKIVQYIDNCKWNIFFKAKKSIVGLKIPKPFERQAEGATCQHGGMY